DQNSSMSNVNEVEAFAHLPVIDAAELAGCPRPQYWNDWFDHQKDDAYWRARSIERRLDRVKVPVLGIAGWHDDARGTIRNYEVMSRLKSAPSYHVVMDAGAHKGIDYVNGYFGPQARVDRRELRGTYKIVLNEQGSETLEFTETVTGVCGPFSNTKIVTFKVSLQPASDLSGQ